MTSKPWVAVIIGCAVMVAPASALAAVTASRITTPASGSWLLDDQVTGHEAITVTGATAGGTSADAVDINCYAGATGSVPLATSVPLAPDGSFTVTIAQGLRLLAKETCVLRAVPAGDVTPYPPGTSSPFTGPTLSIDQVLNVTGPSGQLEYYNLYAGQLMGGFDYRSLGHCPLGDSYVYDPFTFASVPLDACNGGFSSQNSGTAPTRSEVRVDGADAYLAGNAFDIAGFLAAGNPGYPSLRYSPSIDPATGNLALDEIDQLVKCSPGGAYPPTAVSCASFAATGVAVGLHITQGQGGRMTTLVEYFTSTDGRAHTLDLLSSNQFRAPNHDGELGFPWTGGGLQTYSQPGQVIHGPSVAAPGSFFVKGSASVPDGGKSSAQAAVSFSDPPSSVIVVRPTSASVSWLELGYTRTVPARGTVALGFTYSDAFYASEVAVYAAAAETAFRPSVAITSPAGGRRTSYRRARVSGRASDRSGLTMVTVDGRLVPVKADGTWSGAVLLRPGVNTITAAAINLFGNVTQAQTFVTFIPHPPRVFAVSESHRLWRENGPRAAGRPPVDTTFKFSLSTAAQVALAFTEELPGRRIAHRCLAPASGRRHAPRCLRTATVATMSLPGHAGRNSLSFDGVVHGRALAPGRYTLVIVANTSGVLSAPRRLAFTILP
ncbi:MAG TPA: hypothetical protein VIX82_19125 [Solirubrobacteraceae bacterium]